MKVVVVDDEPDVRFLLKLQLEAAGIDVVGVAGSGVEAVEVCAATTPDAVVLDLLMPQGSGFEAIPRLREAQPGVRIVAYSAVAGQFVRDEMARLDVRLVLKAGDIAPLLAALEAP